MKAYWEINEDDGVEVYLHWGNLRITFKNVAEMEDFAKQIIGFMPEVKSLEA